MRPSPAPSPRRQPQPATTGPPRPLPPFAANDLPLEPGIRLLEASAGTGKTFALAHLVLRLVAEAGLALPRLLVVTFTEAAAAELRDRIGRRLQQALTALERPERPIPDAVLQEWLERQDRSRPGAGRTLRARLLLALEGLDGADITTIHGFCARTLARHALEAGRSPQLRLESDPARLLDEVVHDYWRQQLLPLPVHLLAGLRRRGVTPEALRRLLQRLDGDPALGIDPPDPRLPPQRPLPEALPPLWTEAWREFTRLWPEHSRALEAAFCASAATWRAAGTTPSRCAYAGRPRRDRCAELDAWLSLQPPEGDYGAVVEQDLLRNYFHPGCFTAHAHAAEGDGRPVVLPAAPLLAAVAALVDAPAEAVLRHACHWGRSELRRRRERTGTVGFAQLLEALDPGPRASDPTPLLAAVGERYRVALIDEFQDTDPIQWRLLRLAFGGGDHQLVMVGDPKQAIYRFRGGDLATYLEARSQASACLELVENRRSTPALIAGLNALIGPVGLARSALPVSPVVARATRSGPEAAPLELLWLGGERAAGEKPVSRSALEAGLPPLVAAWVCDLLARDLRLERDGNRRPLQPEDICLLVRTHRQAEQLRAALERRGIASRLVSRADVFASPAAAVLQRFLDALADPADAGRLRLLAASPLLGWSARAIATAAPERWSHLAGELERQARQLPRLGLPGLLAERIGSDALARLALGGRLLADLEQVAGLVQEQIHGAGLAATAAADWLRRLRLDESRRDREPPEEHQAHSDRADGAVAVVTVHASKGLEYPVVLCPYLWQAPGGGLRPGAGVRWQPPGEAEPRLDLHLDARWGQGRAAARQHLAAEQAERERLAYVAVTRAQHLLGLAWGPVAAEPADPLTPWLFVDGPPAEEGDLTARSDTEWRDAVADEIVRRGLPMRLLDPPADLPAPRAVAAEPLPLARGPVPERALDTTWGRSSYTRWTHASGPGLSAAALEEGRDTRDAGPELEVAAIAAVEGGDGLLWPEQGPLASFPRGTTAGDCLHRMLEQLDFGRPVAAAANREVVARELRRAGLQDEPLEPVLEGLESLRLTPFGGALGDLRPADLAPERRLSEMAFDLSLGFARADGLAAAFADHPGGAFGTPYARRLAELPVASRGFLTGAIDLIFTAADGEGGQRWWVADWKSNWLGRRDAEGRPVACGPRHYGTAAMAELMAACHYPLQAHLYLVALHRYLAWRLPGYDPAQHLGGYVYVFLRGAPGPSAQLRLPGPVPGMFVERPPLGRVLALDAALGRPASAPATTADGRPPR